MLHKNEPRIHVVTIEVPAVGVDKDALKAAVRRLISKACKFPPDSRFDWERAIIGDLE